MQRYILKPRLMWEELEQVVYCFCSVSMSNMSNEHLFAMCMNLWLLLKGNSMKKSFLQLQIN